jgi:hypothetical protein
MRELLRKESNQGLYAGRERRCCGGSSLSCGIAERCRSYWYDQKEEAILHQAADIQERRERVTFTQLSPTSPPKGECC